MAKLQGVHLPGCRIQSIQCTANELIVIAATTSTRSRCPDCATLSTHVHSYRIRNLRDLPVSQYAVRLRIRLKRYRYQATACPRQTWTETIPDILERYARRTKRFDRALWHIAHALGGNAACRLAHRLYMPTSRDTLLRLLRRTHCGPPSTLHAIGIDDWAQTKGQTYGTIIVDLERHCVVDLLPDREPDTIARWLIQHPQIQIVTRDRSAQYALGIRQGAPQAIQVADRWHLLKNLWEVIERSLIEVFSARQFMIVQPEQATHREPFPRTSSEEALRQTRRERRITRYHQVHYLHKKGHSARRIARVLKMSRGTIRRYLAAEIFPENKRRHRSSILDPYLSYLQQRFAEGLTNAAQLWREIHEQGYPGSPSQVSKWVRQQKRQQSPVLEQLTQQPIPHAILPKPADAVRLLWFMSERLNEVEAYLLTLLIQDQRIRALYQHLQQFLTMLRERDACDFEQWIVDGKTLAVTAYRNFIRSIEQDRHVVKAALLFHWSNGQTEGQIHRLKLFKCQIYGRAKLDLLRIRLMQPP